MLKAPTVPEQGRTHLASQPKVVIRASPEGRLQGASPEQVPATTLVLAGDPSEALSVPEPWLLGLRKGLLEPLGSSSLASVIQGAVCYGWPGGQA